MDRPPNAEAAYLAARITPEEARARGYVPITDAYARGEERELLNAVLQCGRGDVVIVAVLEGTEVWRAKIEIKEASGFSAYGAGRELDPSRARPQNHPAYRRGR